MNVNTFLQIITNKFILTKLAFMLYYEKDFNLRCNMSKAKIETRPVMTRIPMHIYKELQEIAVRNDRDVSKEIKRIITRHVVEQRPGG